MTNVRQFATNQIEKTIRMPISFLVPNSYAEVINAINSGAPIPFNGRSELAVTFRRWVDTLVERSARQSASKSRNVDLGYWACKLGQ